LSTYLDKIIDTKRKEVENLTLLERERTRKIHDPLESLRQKPFITEIKKASPSAGDIDTDVDILRQAGTYRDNGAGAISVLTDTEYFKGSVNDLASVAEAVDIPLLCKDFIISEIQVENACRAGADFILLIAAVLNKDELEVLTTAAKSYGLEVLYEIHGIEELKKLEKLTPELIGVNSRNLKTFSIEKEKAAGVIGDLRREGDFLVVAESGIENSHDVRMFRDAGADAFLIGTALMKSGSPAEKLKEFYSGL
jgi:indole-3-glycerol phosphate synthase